MTEPTKEFYDAELKTFLASHPQLILSRENWKTLEAYLKVHNLPADQASLHVAYTHELSKLKLKPEPAPPALLHQPTIYAAIYDHTDKAQSESFPIVFETATSQYKLDAQSGHLPIARYVGSDLKFRAYAVVNVRDADYATAHNKMLQVLPAPIENAAPVKPTPTSELAPSEPQRVAKSYEDLIVFAQQDAEQAVLERHNSIRRQTLQSTENPRVASLRKALEAGRKSNGLPGR